NQEVSGAGAIADPPASARLSTDGHRARVPGRFAAAMGRAPAQSAPLRGHLAISRLLRGNAPIVSAVCRRLRSNPHSPVLRTAVDRSVLDQRLAADARQRLAVFDAGA